jgi:non-homologous end joining protein Ku
MATNFDPAKLKDKFRQRLKGAISAKIEAGTLNTRELAVKTAPVVDIIAALEASLQAARKPIGKAVKAQSNGEPQKKMSSRG